MISAGKSAVGFAAPSTDLMRTFEVSLKAFQGGAKGVAETVGEKTSLDSFLKVAASLKRELTGAGDKAAALSRSASRFAVRAKMAPKTESSDARAQGVASLLMAAEVKLGPQKAGELIANWFKNSVSKDIDPEGWV